jgi:hypothetical protein
MYQNAQYLKDTFTGAINMIRVNINGVESFVPVDEANADYQEMMRLVAAGELVIAPAQ